MRLNGILTLEQRESFKYALTASKKPLARTAIAVGCIAILVGIITGLNTYLSNPGPSFQWDRITPSLETIGGGGALVLVTLGLLYKNKKRAENSGQTENLESSISRTNSLMSERRGVDPDEEIYQ